MDKWFYGSETWIKMTVIKNANEKWQLIISHTTPPLLVQESEAIAFNDVSANNIGLT